MSKKFHINPKGQVGVCGAAYKCPYGGDENHFETRTDALAAYEAQNAEMLFSTNKKAGAGKTAIDESDVRVDYDPHTFENRIDDAVKSVANKINQLAGPKNENILSASETPLNKFLASKIDAVERASASVNNTLPGTPQRAQAVEDRIKAREDLLAADIATWRSSDFYSPEVEQKMKTNVLNVTLADNALEATLADPKGMALTGEKFGVAMTDVRNVIEYAQRDYLRPRSNLTRKLEDLADNNMYVNGVAHEFRMEPAAVQGIIRSASIYDTEKVLTPA